MFAEAKFRTNNITSQRVMFDLLVAALPEMTLAQVMDIINNILAVNPTCCPTRRRWTRCSSWGR